MSNILASKLHPVVPQKRAVSNLAIVEDEAISQIWSPPPSVEGVVTTDQVLHVPFGTLRPEIETKLIETLTRPIDPGDGHATGGAKRETELRAQLATLDLPQSFHLKRRLETNRAGDPLCAAFQRLVTDRRQRLLSFVGDARRRPAAARR